MWCSLEVPCFSLRNILDEKNLVGYLNEIKVLPCLRWKGVIDLKTVNCVPRTSMYLNADCAVGRSNTESSKKPSSYQVKTTKHNSYLIQKDC